LGVGGRVIKMLSVDFLNVQGLTDVKAVELERIMSEGSGRGELRILALLETHEKYRKVNFSDRLHIVERMRNMEDKKGGGLMLIYRMADEMEVVQRTNGSRDILAVDVTIGCIKLAIVLVYIDVKDKDRNLQIYRNLDEILEGIPNGLGKIVMGDFNAHIGFLGEQRQNNNGELLLNFMERWNLVMLNADDRCMGTYTRIMGNDRSVIDFMLVDEKVYDKFKGMEIDEDKVKFDLSDHCYISGNFEMESNVTNWKTDWETKEYYKVNDQNLMQQFVAEVENKVIEDRVENIVEFENVLKNGAETILKRTIRRRRRRCGVGEKFEPIWINEEIRREIKHRRELNRHRRSVVDPMTREYYWNEYSKQKEKVKKIVKEAKMKHEREITKEITDDKTSRKMWDAINRLRGNTRKNSTKKALYNQDGVEIREESEQKKNMMAVWKQIYQMSENSIKDSWNEVRREKYEEDRMEEINKEEEERVRVQRAAEAGMLYVGRVKGVQKCMREVKFNKENLTKRIKKLKNGKRAGPDGLRGEMYKSLQNSNICIDTMLKAYNGCIQEKILGVEWKDSVTKMVPKEKKPTAEQHRPIALTNVGYKLFMGMVGDKLAEQRLCDERIESLQAGFTEGRRLEENLFVLSYCVEESYRSKQMLVVIAVDFKKAFDSIDRGKMVESMIYYRCDPKVIDIIIDLYDGDRTRIEREDADMGSVEVRNGIRQGCTGSPTLFIMVVSRIIEKVVGTGMGFRRIGLYVPVLFYADDGLILAGSLTEAENMIKVVKEESSKCGLRISAEKSSFMIFNGEVDDGTRIGNLGKCQEMEYLGMKIKPQRDMFAQHRREKLVLAEKMANLSYSVLSRSCNRLLVGKTYWKSVILPSVLKSSQVVVWSRTEKEKLQRIENGVWRRIFDAPSYTPVSALQGEVGCSSVVSRDVKCKLGFVKFIMEGKNGMLRRILNKMKQMEWRGGRTWIGCVEGYLAELEMNWNDVESCTTEQIHRKVDRWEQARWRREVDSKSTLQHYRIKERIGGENYTSGWGSKLLFRVRTNTLKLNWRARFWQGEILCDVCGEEEETLEHFILRCPVYEAVRQQYNVEVMEDVLCFGDRNTENIEKFLERIWEIRWRVVGG